MINAGDLIYFNGMVWQVENVETNEDGGITNYIFGGGKKVPPSEVKKVEDRPDSSIEYETITVCYNEKEVICFDDRNHEVKVECGSMDIDTTIDMAITQLRELKGEIGFHIGNTYYYVDPSHENGVNHAIFLNGTIDSNRISNKNFYATEEEAIEAWKKIKKIL